MDKNGIEINQEELQKLGELAEKEAATISECWGTLLSKSISIETEQTELVDSDDFATMVEFPRMITRVAFGGDVRGDSYFIVPEVDALTISGLLMMMEDDEVAEKRATEYGPDDDDAYKEAINVMLGNIGITLREHLEKDINLSQQETKSISEEEGLLGLRNVLADDRYVVSRLAMTIGDYPETAVYRLFSLPLAKILCGGEIGDLDEFFGVSGGAKPKKPSKENELERILNIPVPVIVRVASKRMSLEEVLKFSPGYIIQFNKNSDENLDLLINDKKIAEGEAITIEERFGLQVKKITSVERKIESMLGDSN